MKFKVSFLFCGKQNNCMVVDAMTPQEAIKAAKRTIIRNMPTESYGVVGRGGEVTEVCSFSGSSKHTFRNFSAKAV